MQFIYMDYNETFYFRLRENEAFSGKSYNSRHHVYTYIPQNIQKLIGTFKSHSFDT